MAPTLRVLIVEDSEDDMLLMLRELRRGGYAVDYVRVETSAAMESALAQQQWDIVIADYSLPNFSAPKALALLQDLNLDLPFIIVSGKIGEETAVAAMKAGAHDYLIKGNLVRLVPAVERELREARERQRRYSAEQALKESEERYRLLFESNPNPMWVFDLETLAFLAVNEAMIAHYGYTKDEFLGMTVADLRLPKDSESEAVEPESTARKTMVLEKHLKKDGTLIDVEIVAHTFSFVGRPASLVLVNDITEKKQLEAQLLRVQRLESLGTLASGIAHDFNNILTPILAASQLLPLMLPNLNEQNRGLLKLIEESTKRGANLIKQILAFARGVEGERLPLKIQPVLLEVVQVIQQTFPKNIEIKSHLPTHELPYVLADATQLHQVLMNLCVNARDAMPHGGKLALSAEQRQVDQADARKFLEARVGTYVVISVADTGTGISDQLLERIFDPFFTTKEQGKGTGLGLSTVLGIVRDHEGFIQVESEVGQGTEFRIFLPTVAAVGRSELEGLNCLTANQELILIVDDEPLIRQVAQAMLESHNYQTLCAGGGLEAIALYKQHQDDIKVVLLDMMMPLMDGIELLKELQQLNPNVRAVAMSGLLSNSYIPEEVSSSVKAFLSKPYTTQALLNALQQALHSNN
jgi:two-component system, cell cycle sensor histidine kinase and response regulator CckA